MKLNLDAAKDLMEARGIDTVSELARMTGIERSLLSRILAGERPAQPSQIKAITEALHARPHTLIAA